MRAALRKILAGVLYGLAVLAFFEAAARAALSSDAFFKRVAGDDDASWRLRFARRQRGETRIYYSFDVHHPTRGWTLRPGLSDIDVFRGKKLSSNSRGLRGAREHAYEKPPGVVRILAFGDSFTFGEDVSDDEAWPHQLERQLPGSEVLNFGIHGYGHDQMLLYLLEEGVKYHPDVVILGFLSDDMERNLLSFRDYAKPRFVLGGERLAGVTGPPIPAPDEMLAREPWRSKFVDLFTILGAKVRARSGRRETEMKRVTLAILDQMALTIRSAGAAPAFAYLPVYGEITKPDATMTSRERFFFSYCRQRGIQSMYLQRFFLDKQKSGVDLKTYGHWGPAEHRTAAEGMRAYLLEKGVIKNHHKDTKDTKNHP